jgi:hypothetical protein
LQVPKAAAQQAVQQGLVLLLALRKQQELLAQVEPLLLLAAQLQMEAAMRAWMGLHCTLTGEV